MLEVDCSLSEHDEQMSMCKGAGQGVGASQPRVGHKAKARRVSVGTHGSWEDCTGPAAPPAVDSHDSRALALLATAEVGPGPDPLASFCQILNC